MGNGLAAISSEPMPEDVVWLHPVEMDNFPLSPRGIFEIVRLHIESGMEVCKVLLVEITVRTLVRRT